MGWVPRQGGSVNATTLARRSAFFFEVSAGDLAEGMARLGEMLQAPRLLRDDIQREVAVIDAEYRLIQQHEPSRREAAVRHAVIAPAAFRRFQVGSADALAGDLPALQAALRDFHRTHYVARRMQFWLQGRSRWRRSASWRHVSPPGLPRARLRRRRRRCAWASSLHCSWRSPASPRCGVAR